MDNLYSIEIDANFLKKNDNQENRANPSDNRVTFLQDDQRQDMNVN